MKRYYFWDGNTLFALDAGDYLSVDAVLAVIRELDDNDAA